MTYWDSNGHVIDHLMTSRDPERSRS